MHKKLPSDYCKPDMETVVGIFEERVKKKLPIARPGT
jgi:hypothetical protein